MRRSAEANTPHVLLMAGDTCGEPLAQVRVSPGFKLNQASAARWASNDFQRPHEG